MGQPRGNVGETMSMGNTIERWKAILAQRKLKGMLGTLGQAFEPPGGKKNIPTKSPRSMSICVIARKKTVRA